MTHTLASAIPATTEMREMWGGTWSLALHVMSWIAIGVGSTGAYVETVWRRGAPLSDYRYGALCSIAVAFVAGGVLFIAEAPTWIRAVTLLLVTYSVIVAWRIWSWLEYETHRRGVEVER